MSALVLHVVDASRPAPARLGGAGPRVLDTLVHYPAAGKAPFPLVVFAHGFDTTPQAYDALTTDWAAHGYVVASPAFPGTVASAGAPPPDESDLANQVADVDLVIGAVERAATARGPLAGLVDPARVAVAGHSDGAETVAGLALDSCCGDPRIKAVIVLAGAELTVAGGHYGGPHPPVLVMQGDADATNHPLNALELFGASGPPAWFVEVVGGDHLGPFAAPVGRWSAVGDATVAFLDWTLRGQPGALRRFTRAASTPGVLRLLAR